MIGTMLMSLAKATGGPVARGLTGSSARVLMYHRFGDNGAARGLPSRVFKQHLEYLTRHFRVRHLGEVVAALREGRPVEPRTAVITIDDGYADFMAYAYPALVRYEVPATVFLVSRFLDGDLWLWFDAVHYLLTRTAATSRDVSVGGELLRLDLSSRDARDRAWSTVGERLLRMSTSGRAAAIISLGAALHVSLPPRPTDDYAAMTWDQAAQMDRALIDVGSHTCTHPVLSRCGSEELVYELHQSRRALSARLGRNIDAFAYPHGEPADYNERAMAAVKAAGHTCAVVSYGGPLGGQSDLFQLTRLSAATDVEQFRSTVNGVELLANKYRAWRHAAAF
jgi:peptidoglycan/xylan/chitin deacetylase (PgdA/CDA1 family)